MNPRRDDVVPATKGWDDIRPGDRLSGHTFGAPMTGEHGDAVQGSSRAYLKTAEERAGQCVTALNLAIEAAQRDVVLATMVPMLADLAGRTKTIEQRIQRLRADK